MGLGLPSDSNLGAVSVFQSLLNNPANGFAPVFAFTPAGAASTLTLGGDDPKQDVSGIKDLPIIDPAVSEIAFSLL